MASKFIETAFRILPCGEKRKIEITPSSQGFKKCKDELGLNEDEAGGFQLQNHKKDSISCVVCGFTADTIDAFPLRVSFKGSDSYYCAKEQCQKAGLPAGPTKSKPAISQKAALPPKPAKKSKYKCANRDCAFSADTLDVFPLQIFSKGSVKCYCTKKKCQTDGMPVKFTEKKRKCGLCDATKKLVKTPCCDNWICKAELWALFGPSTGNCFLSHVSKSQCSYHHNEKHEGCWQDCKVCDDSEKPFDYDFLFDAALKSYNFFFCINCGHHTRTEDDFPTRVTLNGSKRYFCAKKDCQAVALPPRLFKRLPKPKCRMCGRKQVIKKGKNNLTKTECCDRWICDDEYKHSESCLRSHRRYSMCSNHFNEKHEGRWPDCKICQEMGGDYDFSSDEESKNPEKENESIMNEFKSEELKNP